MKCGALSSGEQTRVALAKAMLNQPHLLLLDEPTASLDPSAAREIRARIRELAVSGDAQLVQFPVTVGVWAIFVLLFVKLK